MYFLDILIKTERSFQKTKKNTVNSFRITVKAMVLFSKAAVLPKINVRPHRQSGSAQSVGSFRFW